MMEIGKSLAASLAADAVRGAARPSEVPVPSKTGQVSAVPAYVSMGKPKTANQSGGEGPGSYTATPVRPTPEPNGAPVLPFGPGETRTGSETIPEMVRSVAVPSVQSPTGRVEMPTYPMQTAAQRIAEAKANGAGGAQSGAPQGGVAGLDPALLSLVAVAAAIFLRA